MAQGSSNSGGSGADALSGVSPSQPGSTGTATPQGSSQVAPVHTIAGSGAAAGAAAASASPGRAGTTSVAPACLPTTSAAAETMPSTPQTSGPVVSESPQKPGAVAGTRARVRHDAAREAAAAAVLRRFVQKLSGRDPDLRRPLLAVAGPPDPPEVDPLPVFSLSTFSHWLSLNDLDADASRRLPKVASSEASLSLCCAGRSSAVVTANWAFKQRQPAGSNEGSDARRTGRCIAAGGTQHGQPMPYVRGLDALAVSLSSLQGGWYITERSCLLHTARLPSQQCCYTYEFLASCRLYLYMSLRSRCTL